MDELKKMIEAKEARTAELVKKSESCDDVNELRGINAELQALNKDIADLRAVQAKKSEVESQRVSDEESMRTKVINQADTAEQRSEKVPDFTPGKGFAASNGENRSADNTIIEEREKAGKALQENRSVSSPLKITGELRSITVGDGASIVVPHPTSNTINPNFAVVSSLIDGVDILQLNGGESFRQPYVDAIATGGYTLEGAEAVEADTQYKYVDINKAKITAYSEVTEELLKLPTAPYADNVFMDIRTSMRMLIGKQILVGAGGTNQIVGIFSDKATAIDKATDLKLAAINDTTLDEIVFSYGGSEEVEGGATLILNKMDLLAFAKVRSDGKPFYKIVSNGNAGTINGVPFIINSACGAISVAATAKDTYCMAYGNLKNYKLVEFSPTEVKRSTDFKFRQGMIAHRGVNMLGGNVVHKNGFIRVKKAETV